MPCVSLVQAYAGIKCIDFVFQREDQTLQGLMMGSTVLWINLEMVILSHIISVLTTKIGYLPTAICSFAHTYIVPKAIIDNVRAILLKSDELFLGVLLVEFLVVVLWSVR